VFHWSSKLYFFFSSLLFTPQNIFHPNPLFQVSNNIHHRSAFSLILISFNPTNTIVKLTPIISFFMDSMEQMWLTCSNFSWKCLFSRTPARQSRRGCASTCHRTLRVLRCHGGRREGRRSCFSRRFRRDSRI